MNYQSQTPVGISDDDLEMIQSVAQTFVAKEVATKVARQAEKNDWAPATALWSEMAELGWLGLMSPDGFGGDGLPAISVIAQELGKAAFPMPYSETACFVVPMLARFEDGSVAELLEKLISGQELVTIGTSIAGFPARPTDCAFWPLDKNEGGSIWIADHLDRATAVLLPVQTDEGVSLALVKKPVSGWDAVPNSDLANNSYVALNWAAIASGEVKLLGSNRLTWPELSAAYDALRATIASQIVGLSGAALDMAVAYAKEREAFGKPIGSFQAVQQRLAEAYMENSAARLLASDAAIDPTPAAVAMAAIQACEAGRKCTFTAQQIWAGMGYTLEVDVQLFFRRTKARQLLLGTPWAQRETVWHHAVQSSAHATGAS
ncbi:acyl-CoA dehydrogenase family protein [Pseudorhodobacter sp. W20_MBD10_FR17]|uniref:acyl-CoA dehydrogenase family protein n=1 Tax=Pseudorhodobacter sp. W20_MBD10_FR17 TaxID=3240266 RepID=UPI003F9E9C91